MHDLNKILVPTDFRWGSVQALRHGIAMVEEFGAELHVLHVKVGPLHRDLGVLSFMEMEELRNRMRESVEQQRTALGLQRKSDRPVRYASRRHIDSAQGILDYAADYDISFIVMGTRGRPEKGLQVTGSTAAKVVRHASSPVMTVGADGLFMPGLVHRILVPVDFSEQSGHALILAKTIAQRTRAHLNVLHVIEPAVHLGPRTGSFAIKAGRSVNEAYADLEQFYRRAKGPGVPHRFRVVQGRPAQQIVSSAERQHAHLIIQGGHGATEESSFMLGSVAEDVVRLAPCPVLTVKGAGLALSTRKRTGKKKDRRAATARRDVLSERDSIELQPEA